MQDLFQHAQAEKNAPLAERMRPRELSEVIGQKHLVGEGKPLTRLQGVLPSIILWGPPGTGKTTIARILAKNYNFVQLSAVLSGVKDLREVVEREKYTGNGKTVLFVDEIHRWNKAQQDALLPYVEDGTITLIGATTENPSFTLISPLMSRAKLFVLRPLENSDIRDLLQRALRDRERGLGAKGVAVDDDALEALVEMASGDARRALGNLEVAASLDSHLTLDLIQKVFERKTIRYDRAGDQHYDIISAFIKSMRGSDADAAIYYFARMYEAGEDPRFLARRMVIFASEDIGNADPRALQVAVTAAEAFERIGDAEGWIPLAQAVTYLATAPKSNASYMSYKLAKEDVEKRGDLEVPLQIRNAPTAMMKNLSYGKGYEYAHSDPDSVVAHAHLPKELEGASYYQPSERGYEKTIRERLAWLTERREAKRKGMDAQ